MGSILDTDKLNELTLKYIKYMAEDELDLEEVPVLFDNILKCIERFMVETNNNEENIKRSDVV